MKSDNIVGITACGSVQVTKFNGFNYGSIHLFEASNEYFYRFSGRVTNATFRFVNVKVF